jgi:5-carboxymethyl-2-hydroxymuconate isomerase
MPHLLLEFTSNIFEKDNIANLLQKCHSILVNTLPTEIESCKSRAIEHTLYSIGNGDPNNAFVHVSLKILPGRSTETLSKTSEHIMDLLKRHFHESSNKLNLQLTLEIMELQKTYFKIMRNSPGTSS